MIKVQNWIDGKSVDAESSKTQNFFEPALSQPLGTSPASGPADVERAVKGALEAQRIWGRQTAQLRARVLRKIADGIREELGAFAEAEARNTGKPLSVARQVDIPRAIQNFEFFADAVTQVSSESHSEERGEGAGALHYTLRQPLGVVVGISPWNLPLYLLSWKIAPAIAAGNAIVAKPSEVTPWTAWLLGRVIARVLESERLPGGVVQILNGVGHEIGPALVTHSKIKAVTFTGSTRVGEEIQRLTAGQFKKLSLELGGKNATLIFADKFKLTPDAVVAQAARAAFSNQGQICLCGSRILVEASVAQDFTERLKRHVSEWRAGDPLDANTQFGYLVSEAHHKKVTAAVDAARELDCEVWSAAHTSSVAASSRGWFYPATLVVNPPNNSAVIQEEIFGPVVSIQSFETEAQAIALANSTCYGLSASVFTESLTRAHRVAQALEVGMVWINTWMRRDLRTPFGGVKASGLGREGGWEAFRFFTEPKNVCVQLEEAL